MVTYEYLKSVLEKIIVAHNTLAKLEDNPGDLAIIKKEILKINGFFQVLVNKIDTEKFQSADFSDLKSKLEYYLKNYSFEKEIETMAILYSEDSNRLKNMRLKILESLKDKKLMDNIEYIVEKL
jgi:translation elongation factor EF-1alpha